MGELKSRFFDFGAFQKRLDHLVDVGSLFADFDHAIPRPGKTLRRDRASSEVYVVGLIRTVPSNEIYGHALGNVGNLVFETGYGCLGGDVEDSYPFENLGISFNRPVDVRPTLREKIAEIPRSRVDLRVTYYERYYAFNRTNTPGRFMVVGRFRRSKDFDNRMQLILPDDSIVVPEVLKVANVPVVVTD